MDNEPINFNNDLCNYLAKIWKEELIYDNKYYYDTWDNDRLFIKHMINCHIKIDTYMYIMNNYDLEYMYDLIHEAYVINNFKINKNKEKE